MVQKICKKFGKVNGGGDICFDYGTSTARGVAILLSPDLQFEFESVERSGDGRSIFLHGKIEGKSISIINVYVPNKLKD